MNRTNLCCATFAVAWVIDTFGYTTPGQVEAHLRNNALLLPSKLKMVRLQ